MFESRSSALAFWEQGNSTFRAKIWVLAPPTFENLKQFGVAAAAALQIAVAAILKLEKLHLAVVQQGETLRLPAGWLHAVFSPSAALQLSQLYARGNAPSSKIRARAD